MSLTEANWEPYRNNNHLSIKPPNIRMRGSVSFKEHLDKLLSQRLWEDLIHRLIISGLCVYAHNESQWCLGWGPGHCIVQLDEHEKVANIEFVPYWPGDYKIPDELICAGPGTIYGYTNFPNRKENQ